GEDGSRGTTGSGRARRPRTIFVTPVGTSVECAGCPASSCRAEQPSLVYRHAVQSTSRSVKVTFVVAVVVTIAALGTAVALRMVRAERADDGSSTRSSTAVENAAERCGELPCEVLTSVPVGSTTVELLADPDGKHGRLRFRDDNGPSLRKTALGDLGVHVTQKSLSCADGPTKACVV